MLTYFDHHEQRMRIKRRYLWATWGFGIGLFAGILTGLLIR